MPGGKCKRNVPTTDFVNLKPTRFNAEAQRSREKKSKNSAPSFCISPTLRKVFCPSRNLVSVHALEPLKGPELADKFADLMEKKGITLADLLEDLPKIRQEIYHERYGNQSSLKQLPFL